jgi:hypothetical protein
MQYLGFVNLTPFAAQPLLLNDQRGSDAFTCVVKGTFRLVQNGVRTMVTIADEQVPVCITSEHYGDPETSSLKYESESAAFKLGTDVALIGQARPPYRSTFVDVSLTVGPAKSVVRVFGNRAWTSTHGRWTASDPEPFEALPLVYERAFGGQDRTNPDPLRYEFEPRNPVGVGFVSKKYGMIREGLSLPNLENPFDLISSPTDRPAPAGFGYISPHWQPRAAYAGTYDEAWQKQRMPLLPDDFDQRYYNAAAPGLALRGFLLGGESVEVENASEQGTLRFSLPTFAPYCTVRMRDATTHRFGMVLDGVVVDADEDRLLLTWRGSVTVHKRFQDILWSKAQLGSHATSSQ